MDFNLGRLFTAIPEEEFRRHQESIWRCRLNSNVRDTRQSAWSSRLMLFASFQTTSISTFMFRGIMSSRTIRRLIYSDEIVGFVAEGRFEERTFDRQSKVSGFSLDAQKKSCISLVGAGGICSEIGLALARRGYAKLIIMDFDRVEESNLTRQHYFLEDVGKPKAHCLAKNLAVESTASTFYVLGIALPFEAAQESGINDNIDACVVGVDRDSARLAAAAYGGPICRGLRKGETPRQRNHVDFRLLRGFVDGRTTVRHGD